MGTEGRLVCSTVLKTGQSKALMQILFTYNDERRQGVKSLASLFIKKTNQTWQKVLTSKLGGNTMMT